MVEKETLKCVECRCERRRELMRVFVINGYVLCDDCRFEVLRLDWQFLLEHWPSRLCEELFVHPHAFLGTVHEKHIKKEEQSVQQG